METYHLKNRSKIRLLGSEDWLLLFSRSVVSDSLWSDGLQHARLPWLSLSPRVSSNSCPLSWWCSPTILSSAAPFFFCPQSFPALGFFFFPMSQLFASDGQSAGASASVLPMTIQDWFPLGLTGLILLSKGLPSLFSSTTVQKHLFFVFLVAVYYYIKFFSCLYFHIFLESWTPLWFSLCLSSLST